MRTNLPPITPNPVIEAYKKDVDRTLLRENLKLSVEERFEKHIQFQRFAEALRQAGKEASDPPINGSAACGGDTDRAALAGTHTSASDTMKRKTDGICDLCGHYVGWRQKAHIVAEGRKTGNNLLMLCPTCHIMFDTHVKPKINRALIEAGVENLPKSWEKSIYQEAAEASAKALRSSQRKTKHGD